MKIPRKHWQHTGVRYPIQSDAIKAAKKAASNNKATSVVEEVLEFITVTLDPDEQERDKMTSAEFYLNDTVIIKSNVGKLLAGLGLNNGGSGIKVVNNRKV